MKQVQLSSIKTNQYFYLSPDAGDTLLCPDFLNVAVLKKESLGIVSGREYFYCEVYAYDSIFKSPRLISIVSLPCDQVVYLKTFKIKF